MKRTISKKKTVILKNLRKNNLEIIKHNKKEKSLIIRRKLGQISDSIDISSDKLINLKDSEIEYNDDKKIEREDKIQER